MEIELTISVHALGDCNTADDNERYAASVQTELEAEYPDAHVSVELVSDVSSGSCWVSDDPTGEITENVDWIVNHVWNEANY